MGGGREASAGFFPCSLRMFRTLTTWPVRSVSERHASGELGIEETSSLSSSTYRSLRPAQEEDVVE